MVGTDERRLRRRNANKRSAQKMRDQRQDELEQLRQQMERANQATGFILHQTAELEKHNVLLAEASQHYHMLGQTAQAEGHLLSAEMAKLSSMIIPESAAYPSDSSVQSKHICQPQSVPDSVFVFSSQQLYLPSSAPVLMPAAPATAWRQHDSALSPQADQTSTVSAQQYSALSSEFGAPNQPHCQHPSAVFSELSPPNKMSYQHCSALTGGLAQPSATHCQHNFASLWELQHSTAPFCQHSPTPPELVPDCHILSDTLVEDISTTDLPAIEDLTAGSAWTLFGGGW